MTTNKINQAIDKPQAAASQLHEEFRNLRHEMNERFNFLENRFISIEHRLDPVLENKKCGKKAGALFLGLAFNAIQTCFGKAIAITVASNDPKE